MKQLLEKLLAEDKMDMFKPYSKKELKGIAKKDTDDIGHVFSKKQASVVLKKLKQVLRGNDLDKAVEVANEWCDTIGSDDYSGDIPGPFHRGEEVSFWITETGDYSDKEVWDEIRKMVDETIMYMHGCTE